MEIKLYRKNNAGQPCGWSIRPAPNMTVLVQHGILGKTIHSEYIPITKRNVKTEINSKVNDKRKKGYKLLSEVRDDSVSSPVEEWDNINLINYLTTYLEDDRTTADGSLLPMLAKLYNDSVFKKTSMYIGQWKINGLRCMIRAKRDNSLFQPIRLVFQSREGEYWQILDVLELRLLEVIPSKLINIMLDEGVALDGEIYLPGKTVNEINHYVKTRCEKTKLLQFWCYDIIIDEMPQEDRSIMLTTSLSKSIVNFNSINEHLNNTNQLVVLPTYSVVNDATATAHRDKFLAMGFEGIILRNPLATYQYGKRNMSMIKYKSATDGKFKIIDIYKEPKRDVPIILCLNDINDETFETRLSDSHEYQRKVLYEKDKYIGKYAFVKYGERSGVKRVPFHIKEVVII